LKVGIVGAGGIGLAYAAWIAARGHEVKIWAHCGETDALKSEPLVSTGIVERSHSIELASDIQDLIDWASLIVIAVPASAHRAVMDAMIPHLQSGQNVVVSSMASLSSLYLYEQALSRNINVHVGNIACVLMPATESMVAVSNLILERDCLTDNNFVDLLKLHSESVSGLLKQVGGSSVC